MKDGEVFEGISQPNYTQVPDNLLDHAIAHMSGNEFKIVMYICRRTYGWKQPAAKISLQQLMLGTGPDEGTGITRRASIIGYISNLRKRGFLVAEVSRGKTMTLRLRLKGEPVDSGQDINQATCTESVHPPQPNLYVSETSTGGGSETSTGTVLKLPSIETNNIQTNTDRLNLGDGTESERAPTNQGKSRKPRTKQPVENWVARFGDKLREHAGCGPAIYGQLAGQLKGLVQALGEEELYRRWANFCENCDPNFLYPGNFTKNTAKWIPRAGSRQAAAPRSPQPNGAAPTEPPAPPIENDPEAQFWATYGDRIQH
jgi:hypothetical protein